MTTPLVLYLLNEAASGTSPLSVADSAATPLNMDIVYSVNGAAWTTNSAGRCFGTEKGASLTKDATSTKLSATLGGTSKVTLIAQITRGAGAGTSNFGPLIALIDSDGADVVSFYASGNNIQVYTKLNGDSAAAATYALGINITCTVAAVIDTTQATAANRIKLYVDVSTAVADGSSGTTITQNSTLTFGSGTKINSGSYWVDANTFYNADTKLGNVSIVADALSGAEIAAIATALNANNDANPFGSLNRPVIFMGANF